MKKIIVIGKHIAYQPFEKGGIYARVNGLTFIGANEQHLWRVLREYALGQNYKWLNMRDDLWADHLEEMKKLSVNDKKNLEFMKGYDYGKQKEKSARRKGTN